MCHFKSFVFIREPRLILALPDEDSHESIVCYWNEYDCPERNNMELDKLHFADEGNNWVRIEIVPDYEGVNFNCKIDAYTNGRQPWAIEMLESSRKSLIETVKKILKINDESYNKEVKENDNYDKKVSRVRDVADLMDDEKYNEYASGKITSGEYYIARENIRNKMYDIINRMKEKHHSLITQIQDDRISDIEVMMEGDGIIVLDG